MFPLFYRAFTVRLFTESQKKMLRPHESEVIMDLIILEVSTHHRRNLSIQKAVVSQPPDPGRRCPNRDLTLPSTSVMTPDKIPSKSSNEHRSSYCRKNAFNGSIWVIMKEMMGLWVLASRRRSLIQELVNIYNGQ